IAQPSNLSRCLPELRLELGQGDVAGTGGGHGEPQAAAHFARVEKSVEPLLDPIEHRLLEVRGGNPRRWAGARAARDIAIAEAEYRRRAREGSSLNPRAAGEAPGRNRYSGWSRTRRRGRSNSRPRPSRCCARTAPTRRRLKMANRTTDHGHSAIRSRWAPWAGGNSGGS